MEVVFDTSALDKVMDRITKTLNDLDGKQIEIGVLGDDSELQMIAHVQEYGATITVTPKMRAWFAYQGYPLKASTTQIVIPERSFLRGGRDKNKGKIKSKVADMMPKVIEGGVPVKLFLESIGEEYAGLIQKELRDLKSPPNAPMTADKKGSSNPLVDTGRLMGAIRSEVK